MRKQTWLAAVILSCGVLMAGCGSGNRSYQKGIKAMQAGEYEDAGTFSRRRSRKMMSVPSIILLMACT